MDSTLSHRPAGTPPPVNPPSATPPPTATPAAEVASPGATTTQPRNSVFGLVRNLTREVRTLIRQEIRLAKTEVSEKVQHVTRNGVALAIGGVIAYSGLIVLLIGLGFLVAWAIHLAGIEGILASFLGLLGIGLLTIVIGGALVMKGLNAIRKESFAPQRTLHTLKDLRGGKSAVGTASGGEKAASSKEIQTRVEATEAQMGQTLDELGRRLDPQYLSAQVKHRIQEKPFKASFLAAGAGLLSGLLLRRRTRHA